MKGLRIVFALVLALSPLAGCGFSHGRAPDAPAGDPGPTRLADGVIRIPEASLQFLSLEPLGNHGASVEVRLPARVAFREGAMSQVGTPMAGRVTRIWVKTGDHVRNGDPLVTLASPEAATARTALASARASLREARAAVDRETRMLEEGVGIERDRLAAEVKLQEAQAEADRAAATGTLVGPGTGTELVVHAPLAGTVLSVKSSVGAAVEPGGDALVEVGDPTALCILADATEHDLPLIREGAEATVDLTSVSRALRARVVSVGAVVNAGLRTAPVRLALDVPPSELRPGMYGRARIASAPAGSSLPAEAVLIKNGRESVVYVAKDERTFERRSVIVGRSLEGRVQVLSGLEPGERVVVKGALLLDGAAEQLL